MADDASNPQQTRASHVRTFAKDLARAQGKPQPAPAPMPPPPPKVEPPLPTAPKINVSDVIPDVPIVTEKTERVDTPNIPVPPPPPPVPQEARDAILERLRAKVAAGTSAPAAPTPEREVTRMPPVQKPVTSPIHTYKSDFAEHIDEKKASVFSVMAAEKDSADAIPEALAPKRRRNVSYVVGGMLILLGIVGVYAAYRWSMDQSIIPTEDMVPSLIFPDARKEISGTGPELMDALVAVAADPLPQGDVMVTYVSVASTTEKGVVNFPAPGGALIRALALPAPDILLRNIAEESTVGVIHAGEEQRAFFILRVLSYERTFAGMLEWEDTIATDLALLYPAYPVEVATTTATSTPPVPPAFVDDVVASRDVRTLVDAEGRIVLVYGYRDKTTLVIARDEAAFTQLLERLAASR